MLLEAGARVDAKNNLKQTALTWAAWKGSAAVCSMLLEAGAGGIDAARAKATDPEVAALLDTAMEVRSQAEEDRMQRAAEEELERVRRLREMSEHDVAEWLAQVVLLTPEQVAKFVGMDIDGFALGKVETGSAADVEAWLAEFHVDVSLSRARTNRLLECLRLLLGSEEPAGGKDGSSFFGSFSSSSQ